MNFRFVLNLFLLPGTMAFLALASGAFAETPARLIIQNSSNISLTITGAVGTLYTVQFTTELGPASDWHALTLLLANSPDPWVDTNAPAAGSRFYRAVAGPTNLVWIPAGTFTMGSADSEPAHLSQEAPQTMVTISRGFNMGKYEVTQGEYLQVMGTNPSYFGGELSYPVETVSWNDAVEYCTALTRQERSAGRLPEGVEYRLPTEAQWEYACRAGTSTPFHYGDALRSGMANFHGRFEYPPCDGEESFCWNPSGVYLERTTSVGSHSPNAWGLYDMHGNVWEWCSDWWSANLPGGSVLDPTGPPDLGELRVLRGGSWDYNAASCRTAFRYGSYPDSSNAGSGFRVVLVWAQ